MILYHTLDKHEVVYSWENPDPPGGVRMWCVERMEKWCVETERKVLVSAVEDSRAEWFIENRGIEQHRLKWLLENPLVCANPCLLMRLPRTQMGIVETWDLMLDGHHRYVALAMMGMPVFKLWHLQEEEAKAFEVCGFPQPKPGRGLNINSFSGLGWTDDHSSGT